MNLKTILAARNKSKLPKNSLPGVYMVNCCGSKYVGETSDMENDPNPNPNPNMVLIKMMVNM